MELPKFKIILILKPNWQDIGKYFLPRIMDDDITVLLINVNIIIQTRV